MRTQFDRPPRIATKNCASVASLDADFAQQNNPLGSTEQFKHLLTVRSPAAVSTEEQAEESLKMALANLALAGVAFHVCEHCSARDAYRIFIEDVCSDAEDSGAFRPLIGTGWVQNFCSSDHCKKCREDD